MLARSSSVPAGCNDPPVGFARADPSPLVVEAVVTASRLLAIADALAADAGERFGTTVTVVGEPTTAGEGMDNEIVFVRLAGDGLPGPWQGPLVVRVQPDAERYEIAEAEVAVQRWCQTVGYPAPDVLALYEPGRLTDASAQVMVRVPGVPMLEGMVPAVWRSPALVARLADLHVQLHGTPSDGWPLAEVSLARRRLLPVRSWVDELHDTQLREALSRVDELLPYLEDHEAVPCHGDFHPLNVLVDGDSSSVIDWTDAGLGDRHGDVARTQLLFRVAAVAATSRAERVLLRALGPRLAARYLRCYSARLPLDRDRLDRWEVVHLLHGWAQVRALHAGIIGRDRERERVPPTLAPWLQRRLERRLDAT
jgi:aminoglycoside phosphotransferase (APT) family kinase protein